MLTEKEAWLKLAGCWENIYPVQEPFIYIIKLNDYEPSGLCTSIKILHKDEEIYEYIENSMLGKIEIEKTFHVGGYGLFNAYIWPQTKEGAIMRAGFCRAMAEAIG